MTAATTGWLAFDQAKPRGDIPAVTRKRAVLRMYAIEAGGLRAVTAPAEALPPQAVWIDLVEPTRGEEEALERVLGVNIPTRGEVSGIQTSNRLAAGDGALYMTALVPDGRHVASAAASPLTFVRAGDRLVTVRYSAPEALNPLIERCSSGRETLHDADDLVATLLEAIVDRIADQLEKVGASLDHVGHAIFRHPAGLRRRTGRRVPIGRRIQRLEGVIEDLGVEQGLAAKLRECFQSLIRLVAFAREHGGDGYRKRLEAVEVDFRAISEYEAYLAAHMDFMLNATVGLIDIQQNKVIYLLSIVGVVLTPPVLVASIYGMNFQQCRSSPGATVTPGAWP
jgi:magnesium transporter